MGKKKNGTQGISSFEGQKFIGGEECPELPEKKGGFDVAPLSSGEKGFGLESALAVTQGKGKKKRVFVV